MKKFRKFLFKLLFGIDPDTLVINEVKNINDFDNFSVSASPRELKDNYLFDFKNFMTQYNDNYVFGNTIDGGNTVDSGGVFIPTEYSAPKKIKVKPIDVLNELETIPNPFSLTLLDEKIEMLKDKTKLIVQYYAKREIEALIERLENRKKYLEFKSFFDRFQNTTDEKINVLLNKYELVMKTSDIFVPEFPNEAVNIMKEYISKMKELCGKKPLFYVIATADSFQDKNEKRDPILLVQSPFGFYWQILGVWDKEMLILSEL
jgi:hypothetical protein